MMELYFQCNWIIDPDNVQSIADIYDVAHAVGAEISFSRPTSFRIDLERDYVVGVFVIKVTAEAMLIDFLTHLRKEVPNLNLETWEKTDSTFFTDPANPRDSMYKSEYQGWLDTVFLGGIVNEEVRKNRSKS